MNDRFTTVAFLSTYEPAIFSVLSLLPSYGTRGLWSSIVLFETCTMYGLLLQAIAFFMHQNFGEDVCNTIFSDSRIGITTFGIHEVYSENYIPRIVDVASSSLQITKDELLMRFGASFVDFIHEYGYEKILRVLGRHYRDFLNGLDNLHE